MSETRAKPIPLADELSAPFWAAATEGRLEVQRCACGYYNHPPRLVCDACLSQELKFEPVSGKGKIYSFTIMHQGDVAGFEGEAPFLNVVIELDAQPMLLMVANLPAASREGVKIGAPVAVQFEDRGGGIIIPQFRLVEQA